MLIYTTTPLEFVAGPGRRSAVARSL